MQSSPASLASRLGAVCTGLRNDLDVTRHTFRGEPFYVIRNPITFQSHRFSAHDYQIVVSLCDERTLSQVFAELVASGRLNDDQEEDFYGFILSLHQFGLLDLPVSNGKDLYARFRKRKAALRKSQLAGFLFWRMPLFNPNAFLDRTAHLVAPLFTKVAGVLWLILVIVCGVILVHRWHDFVEPLQTTLIAENLVGLWVLLIGLKFVHEFGHAYACKLFGGRVPEMGAFFICFTPCAYVDASAAWGFEKKTQRIMVSLAGMYVESIVACIALLVWHATGPSWLNSYAHHAVTLASIVTIGFNINPLMKFDGYFVLSDLVEIPNLREQSTSQLKHVLKRWCLGIDSPKLSQPRYIRVLLFAYGLAASVWKVVLTVGICAAVALKIYFWGVLLAIIFGATVIWSSLSQILRYLWVSPETQSVRRRAVGMSVLACVGIPLLVAAVPIETRTEIPGTVFSQGESIVCSQAAGFVRQINVTPGQSVRKGEILCVLENPELVYQADQLAAELSVFDAKALPNAANNPVETTLPRIRAGHLARRLAFAQNQIERLCVRCPRDGVVVECDSVREIGSFVDRGQTVATIAADQWCVRAYARDEELADWTPTPGQRLGVRLQGKLSQEVDGVITTASLRGVRQVRDVSLTQVGGGNIPADAETLSTNDPYFEIRIALPAAEQEFIKDGMTAIVSCPSQSHPLGLSLYRAMIRFLNRLRR